MRNFQLVGTQNATPLLHQLARHPELWNQNTIRTAHAGTAHAQVDDILVRFQDLALDVIDDAECIWWPAFDVLTEASKLIFDLAYMVKAERIGRVIVSRLPSGAVIMPHEDGGAVSTYYTRYQMPLQSRPGCVFECAGEKVQMQDGQVWWFDNKKTHAVFNNSADDRIAMIVDLKTR